VLYCFCFEGGCYQLFVFPLSKRSFRAKPIAGTAQLGTTYINQGSSSLCPQSIEHIAGRTLSAFTIKLYFDCSISTTKVAKDEESFKKITTNAG
jgi:hypothetical protein